MTYGHTDKEKAGKTLCHYNKEKFLQVAQTNFKNLGPQDKPPRNYNNILNRLHANSVCIVI